MNNTVTFTVYDRDERWLYLGASKGSTRLWFLYRIPFYHATGYSVLGMKNIGDIMTFESEFFDDCHHYLVRKRDGSKHWKAMERL